MIYENKHLSLNCLQKIMSPKFIWAKHVRHKLSLYYIMLLWQIIVQTSNEHKLQSSLLVTANRIHLPYAVMTTKVLISFIFG